MTVDVDARRFRVGRASVEGTNCLIDALGQVVGIDLECDIDAIRQLAQQEFTDVSVGGPLGLREHWVVVIRCLSPCNRSRMHLAPPDYEIVCVDIFYIGR